MVALPYYTSIVSRERIAQDARKRARLFLDYSLNEENSEEDSDGAELFEEGSTDEYQESNESDDRLETVIRACVGTCGKTDVSVSPIWYECFEFPEIRCDDYYYCDDCHQNQPHPHDQKAHRVLKIAQNKDSKPDDLEPSTDDEEQAEEDRLVKIEEEIGKLGERFSRMEALLTGLAKNITPN